MSWIAFTLQHLLSVKKYSLGMFLICFLSLHTVAANTTLIEAAQEAYSKEDFQTAIEKYEQIVSNGNEAFELYYNLGNAYFKTDQLGLAILNYERAAKINPTDTDLNHNLAIAQSRTVDKIEVVSAPEFVSGFKSFVNATPADSWGIYSLMAFTLFLIALGIFFFLNVKNLKQLSLLFAAILLMLSLGFFYFGWQQQRWLNSNKEGIILQASVTVSSTPDQSGEELFVLHEGTKVRILEYFKDKTRIRITNGNIGWLFKNDLQEI